LVTDYHKKHKMSIREKTREERIKVILKKIKERKESNKPNYFIQELVNDLMKDMPGISRSTVERYIRGDKMKDYVSIYNDGPLRRIKLKDAKS